MSYKDDIEYHPVFILGAPHSGTTILYRMLARAEDFAFFSNYCLRNGEITGRKKLPFVSNIAKRILRNKFMPPWQKNIRGIHGFLPIPEESDIWNSWIPSDKIFEFTDPDEKKIEELRQIIAEECSSWRKKYLLIKKPALSNITDFFGKALPNAKFVHIVRDGKATSISMQNKFANTPYGRAASLRLSAEYWGSLMQYLIKCQEIISDERMTTVKYEDLCKNPPLQIMRILEFCGLNGNNYLFRDIPEQLHNTNQRRITSISNNDKCIVNEIIAEQLDYFDYPLFEIE